MHLRFIIQFLQLGLDYSFLIAILFIHGSRNHKNTAWRCCFHKHTNQGFELQMWKMLNDHHQRTNNHEKKISIRQQEKRKTNCCVWRLFQIGCWSLSRFISRLELKWWNTNMIDWSHAVDHRRTSFIVKFPIVQTLQRKFITFHVACVEKEQTNRTDRIWLLCVDFTMKKSMQRTRKKIFNFVLKL